MILFFDACSSKGYIALYSDSRKVLGEERFNILGNESSKITGLIHSFLEKQRISYEQIKNIICVNGPGSFTGIRTITLVVNSLAYIYPNIFLTPVNYFDLIDSYPLVKASSKRDLFVKYKKGDIIHIVSNTDFEKNIELQEIFGDIDSERFKKKYIIHSNIEYTTICNSIPLQKNKKIAPVYIKKPNIT